MVNIQRAIGYLTTSFSPRFNSHFAFGFFEQVTRFSKSIYLVAFHLMQSVAMNHIIMIRYIRFEYIVDLDCCCC